MLLAAGPKAELVINEVFANEPSNYGTLEWIELYNNGGAVPLDNYYLVVNGKKEVSLPECISLESGAFYIICRCLYEDQCTHAFESYWGDNSGVWGDSEEEAVIQEPYRASFVLTNDTGSVFLYDSTGAVVSSMQWFAAADDGFSLERIHPDSAGYVQSEAPRGATPGAANYCLPPEHDLSLDSVEVNPGYGGNEIIVYIGNVGSEPLGGSRLYISEYDSEIIGDTIAATEIPSLSSGEMYVFDSTVHYESSCMDYLVHLSSDDRVENNSLPFSVAFYLYPPLMITEFLANPTTAGPGEWVELYSLFPSVLNLRNCKIADERGEKVITSNDREFPQETFIVLVEDSLAFASFYPEVEAAIVEPSSWPGFNNDGDLIKIIDYNGLTIDSLSYSELYEDNYTIGRDPSSGNWGRSEIPGGSPGQENRVVHLSDGQQSELTIVPEIFSPDGDGVDEEVTIKITAPEGQCSLYIYNRDGRKVATLFENCDYPPSEICWKGGSGWGGKGGRLPIGIYIVYLESDNSGSAKRTVVIAR